MKKTKAAKQQTQQDAIRQAREALDLTTEELADQMEVSLSTMRAWLMPATSKAHRKMPKMARSVLARMVKEHRAAQRGK